MKHALSLLLAFGLLLCSAMHGFALSDDDYKKYVKESPAFAQADKDLGSAWKAIKKANGGNIPAALLSEQRQWIQAERDSEAAALLATMSPADAYTQVTNNRVRMLKTVWLKEQPPQAAPGQPAQKRDGDDALAGTYQYSAQGKVTITNTGNNEYAVEIATYSDHQASFFTEFSGTGKLADGVLTVTNQEKVQDREWVNGKLVEKPTFRIVTGTAVIYTARHPDVLRHASQGEDSWGFAGMKEAQIAIIAEPAFTEGGDKTPLPPADMPPLEFYAEGASGGPGIVGLYTKNSAQ